MEKKKNRGPAVILIVVVLLFIGAIGNALEDEPAVTDQDAIKTVETQGKPEPETLSAETIPKETKEEKPEEIRADYISSCQTVPADEIITNPILSKEKNISVSGIVVEADNTWSFWTGKGFNAYIDDGESVWYIVYTGKESQEIKENDALTCYGECVGTELYTPDTGYSYTVPSVDVKYFDVSPAPETEPDAPTTETSTSSSETETKTPAFETIVPSAITPEEERADFISSCKTPDYKDIERNPAAHEFELIKFTGKVIQVSEGWFNSVILRVNDNGNIWYVEYTRKDGEPRILEDDIITCYGTCIGVKSYTSLLGATITIPAADMEYFEFSENNPPASAGTTVEPNTQSDPYEGLTMGQKNALKKAESYLSFMSFSWQGLIDQLIYDQFSEEDALYAANNCGADWQKQALKKAESYLSFSSLSYTSLISQLEYDKFSTELATYAADNCGADWNEQAAKKAKSYLDFMAYSRDRLISQLEYEGFTHEQAVYGVEQNGY